MVMILKKGKTIRNIIFVIILLGAIAYSGYNMYRGLNSTPGNVKKVQTIDNIDTFDYTLNDNATKYYKTLFNELKKILSSEPVDEKEYAQKVSQLFISDLFTLDNKLTSSDIGGLEYVYKDFRDDFISFAQTGMYASVKSNVYGDRKQELPEVTEVSITEVKNDAFKIKDKTIDNAYYITAEIKYSKDLGYPKKYSLVLVKNDKKIEVVKAGEAK